MQGLAGDKFRNFLQISFRGVDHSLQIQAVLARIRSEKIQHFGLSSSISTASLGLKDSSCRSSRASKRNQAVDVYVARAKAKATKPKQHIWKTAYGNSLPNGKFDKVSQIMRHAGTLGPIARK